MTDVSEAHLAPTRSIDSTSPAIVAFAERHAGTGRMRERAARLYDAVRDHVRCGGVHPFDVAGCRHMEYIRFHGEFDDLPFEQFASEISAADPRMLAARAEERAPRARAG